MTALTVCRPGRSIRERRAFRHGFYSGLAIGFALAPFSAVAIFALRGVLSW